MSSHADHSNRERALIVVAAPRECRSVLDGLGAKDLELPSARSLVQVGRFDVVIYGVGKSNAAGATARFLDPSTHARVLSVGIAGGLPGLDVKLLDVVVARHSLFGDEGIGTNKGFIPMDEAGFGAFPDGSMGVDHERSFIEHMNPVVDWVSHIATVSWCSGTDACAQGVMYRTGAVCEAMEGASVALVAKRVDPSILTGELRVVSNTTGDRANQRWALDESLDRLREVLGRVASLRD